MSRLRSELPLQIAAVNRINLLSALQSVQGCLKTASMLWMHALGLRVLSGVVVSDWSRASALAVHKFAREGGFSELLLRIDKRRERWGRRRGGYILSLGQVPAVVRDLQREGRIAVLLEPLSPYADQYSLAGVTIPDEEKMVIEVVGPGFDASDILRGDLQPHERWEATRGFDLSSPKARKLATYRRVYMVNQKQYEESVQKRLVKIGARLRDPAFPDTLLKGSVSTPQLAHDAVRFLKGSHQTTLLRHTDNYIPIPQKHVASFARGVENLLAGLSAYGIHLGSSSFAASVIPGRGLVFWDFFPARKQEAASLYGA